MFPGFFILVALYRTFRSNLTFSLPLLRQIPVKTDGIIWKS